MLNVVIMESHKKFYRVFRLISLLSSPPAKSINSLASSIDVTERSLYRYIELLEALGFEIEKDASKHYFITSSEHDSKEVFTLEEADLIRQIIISQGNKSPLADGILKKLYINTEVNISVNHLINANLSSHINKLSEAIATNTQAILKQYFSLNSETVTDRLIEPIGFTDNYKSLMAYEVETGRNKYFNIERITQVVLTDSPIVYTDKHEFQKPDIFGFAPNSNGKTHEIHLQMTMKAYLLLKEEYPLTLPYTKAVKGDYPYELTASVNNLKPVIRFCNGLKDEVQIISGFDYTLSEKLK